jgi:hypothetical protein
MINEGNDIAGSTGGGMAALPRHFNANSLSAISRRVGPHVGHELSRLVAWSMRALEAFLSGAWIMVAAWREYPRIAIGLIQQAMRQRQGPERPDERSSAGVAAQLARQKSTWVFRPNRKALGNVCVPPGRMKYSSSG